MKIKTRFLLRKGKCTTATCSLLAVAKLHFLGWKVVVSELGELL